LIRADATFLPFPTACFDGVVVQFSLHEMDEPALSRSLKEISRVAAPKALFFLADFVPSAQLTFSKIILNVVERLAGSRHYRNGRRFLKSGGLPSVLDRMNLKPISLHRFFEGNVYLAVAHRRDVIWTHTNQGF
jgi:ubiquinone/menaquinone biosynthesis C-methylase UbiE